jgi:hypothetical protein
MTSQKKMSLTRPTEKQAAPPSKRRNKAANKKQPSAKERSDDSDDIERAVYDGMQDLRAGKSAARENH